MQINRTGEKILLTLWVGGHWMVGFMAVPLIQNVLKDDAARSSILQQLFNLMNFVAIGACALLLLLTALRLGWKHWRMLVLAASAAVALVLQVWVYPQVAAAEAGSDAFAAMHGTSMTLYLILGVLGLALVVFDDDPRQLMRSKSDSPGS